jgi:hypothetical protein
MSYLSLVCPPFVFGCWGQANLRNAINLRKFSVSSAKDPPFFRQRSAKVKLPETSEHYIYRNSQGHSAKMSFYSGILYANFSIAGCPCIKWNDRTWDKNHVEFLRSTSFSICALPSIAHAYMHRDLLTSSHSRSLFF